MSMWMNIFQSLDNKSLATSNLFFIKVSRAECPNESLYQKVSFPVLNGGSI